MYAVLIARALGCEPYKMWIDFIHVIVFTHQI